METSSSVAKAKSKTWLVIEKIIALLLILWGVLVLYSVVFTVYNMLGKTYITLAQTTTAQIISKGHPSAIVSIICIFGGFLLLYGDKRGWILSVVSTFVYAIILGISSKSKGADTTLLFSQFYKSYGAVALTFGVAFIILLLKYFREKYKPSTKNFIWIAVIVAILIADNMIFR